jgi:hypothetical protein
VVSAATASSAAKEANSLANGTRERIMFWSGR